MAKIKNLEDLLAEQAVRKAVTCYSRGADRCDIDILKSFVCKIIYTISA